MTTGQGDGVPVGQWVTLGDRAPIRVRADQIAMWHDDYMNGYQHYIYVTLINGQKFSGIVSAEQWAAFQKAVQ